MPPPIYLDNNATTQIATEVLTAMKPFLKETFANPSSSYQCGREGRAAVEDARRDVAGLLGATDPAEIVFTSGGTESDNWAIRGALSAHAEKKHIVTTRVEHEAVRNVCLILEKQGHSVTWLEVDESGAIDLDVLKASLRKDTAIVSIMLANNETGVIFPVNEAAVIVKENSEALFHVDAVNAAGKVGIGIAESRIDLLSISGHKFHAPKGVGALYIRRGITIDPFLIGGGQESGRRAGTEAVHQIAGLGEAARLASDTAPMENLRKLRDRLEKGIFETIPNAFLNGTDDPAKRLPNTSNISFENVNGEAILACLDAQGIFVSTGSACNSADHMASPVLQAMNIPYSRAMGSIRFSLGRYNSTEEIDRVLEILPEIVGKVRSMPT